MIERPSGFGFHGTRAPNPVVATGRELAALFAQVGKQTVLAEVAIHKLGASLGLAADEIARLTENLRTEGGD